MILSSNLERKRWLYSCKVYDRQEFVVVVDGFNEMIYLYRLVGINGLKRVVDTDIDKMGSPSALQGSKTAKLMIDG